MSDPFLAEIRIFGFNFAPRSWAFCNGQVLPLQQNVALFSLLGTTYGGNGTQTFALPNLQGNAPMAAGNGAGLSPHSLGEVGGSANVTLTSAQVPPHSHTMQGYLRNGNLNAPNQGSSIARSTPGNLYQNATTSNLVSLSPQALAAAGGNGPHNNMQPYLPMNFCIALQGIFPPRP